MDSVPFPGEPCLEQSSGLPMENFHLLMRSMRLHKAIMSKALKKHRVFFGQMFCLNALHHEQGVSQNDLAERMGVRPPTVSKMLGKLEEAGHICRKLDRQDHRITRIFLTPSGEELYHTLQEVAKNQVEETLGSLAESDQQTLRRILGEYISSIENLL